MKKVLKLNVSKKVILPLAIFTAFCGIFSGCSINPSKDIPTIEVPPETQQEIVEVCSLPDQETIKNRLAKIYSDEKEMFLLAPDWNNEIKRMPCKKNEPIKINVRFDANTIAHVAFDSAAKELNELFAVVNPNYVFEMEYTPTEQDVKDLFNIDINSKDDINGTALAITYPHLREYYDEIDGSEIVGSYIDIKSAMFQSDVSRLKYITLHELCHCIGLGDAYENPDATSETIMQSWSINYHPYVGLEVIDAATLAALYYDGTTPADDVAEFVTNYKMVYKDHSLSASLNEECNKINALNWQQFTEKLDTAQLKQQISKLPNFKYYSPSLVKELFDEIDKRNFDTTFGESVFQAGEIFEPNCHDTNTMHYISNQWENNRVYDLFQTNLGSIGCWLYSFGRTTSGQLIGRDCGLYVKLGDFILSGKYEEKYDHVDFSPDGVYKITTLTPTDYFAQFGIDCSLPRNLKNSSNSKNAEKSN